MAESVKDDPTTTNRRLQTIKKQSILTGDQRHRNDIKNGQRVSRISLPTICKDKRATLGQHLIPILHSTNGQYENPENNHSEL
jgi:hypothetical protein